MTPTPTAKASLPMIENGLLWLWRLAAEWWRQATTAAGLVPRGAAVGGGDRGRCGRAEPLNATAARFWGPVHAFPPSGQQTRLARERRPWLGWPPPTAAMLATASQRWKADGIAHTGAGAGPVELRPLGPSDPADNVGLEEEWRGSGRGAEIYRHSNAVWLPHRPAPSQWRHPDVRSVLEPGLIWHAACGKGGRAPWASRRWSGLLQRSRARWCPMAHPARTPLTA